MASKKDTQKQIAVKKAKFKKAYISCYGNVTMSCKKCRIGRQTFYLWRDKDIITKDDLKEWNHIIQDKVEALFIKKDLPKDFKARRFWLERRHRDYKPNPLHVDNLELNVGVIVLPALKAALGLDGTEHDYFTKAKDGSFVETQRGTTDLRAPKE